jgi:glycerophosphoryl diester phosphodiesterase
MTTPHPLPTAGTFRLRDCVPASMRMTLAGLLPYLAVIAVLQGAIVFIAIPAIEALFAAAVAAAGFENLTGVNLLAVLGNPLATLIFLGIAVTAFVAVNLQVFTVLVMANCQQSGMRLTFRTVAKDVIALLRSLANIQSPLLVVYVFVVAPIGGLELASALTRDIDIPHFVSNEFMKTPLGTVGYSAVIAAVVYLNFRLVLVLPAMVVTRSSPLRALRTSLRGTRVYSWRLALALIGVIALATLLIAVTVEIMVGLTLLADTVLPSAALPVAAASIGSGEVVSFLTIGLATIVVAHILVSAGRACVGLPTDMWHVAVAPKPFSARKRTLIARLVALVSAGAIGFSAVPVMASPVDGAADTLIIAHRGYVGGGVENTIGALEAAAATHPDVVEVDVMQTKDGQFVASHDTNLLLLAGMNVNISELTLEEATAITVSTPGFSDTIPSLRDYVTRADELDVPLLIEVKVHGQETADYLDLFLAELDALGVTAQNSYHSLSVDAVEGLKDRRPELAVGYTVAINLGLLPDIDCDFIVVEQSSFSESLLEQARIEGKPVYVWTVNSEDAIRDYLRVPVQGIVTDHPLTVAQERDALARERGLSARVRDALDYLTVFDP